MITLSPINLNAKIYKSSSPHFRIKRDTIVEEKKEEIDASKQ